MVSYILTLGTRYCPKLSVSNKSVGKDGNHPRDEKNHGDHGHEEMIQEHGADPGSDADLFIIWYVVHLIHRWKCWVAG